MYTKEQIKQMPILDSIVCNYGNHRQFNRYRVAYDYCGEFACIELIAPNLDSIVIYLNQMNIKASVSSFKPVEANSIWTFTSDGVPYYIYKLEKFQGMPQQFYAG